MSKKKWIDEILPIPKHSKYIIHDSWIGLIISLNGKISYLDKPTIKYRQHSENQVGTDRESYKCNSFEQVRNLFINVKKDLFKTYIENQKKFPEELQKLNYEGKKYFDDIEKKKNVNLRNWGIFYNLYKNENIGYYIAIFVILNLPILGNLIYKVYKKKGDFK